MKVKLSETSSSKPVNSANNFQLSRSQTISNLASMGFFYPQVRILLFTASLLPIGLQKNLSNTAYKLHAMSVIHPYFEVRENRMTVLCPLKNIATKEVIRLEEDKREFNRTKQQLQITRQKVDSNFQFSETRIEGICQAACETIIEEVSNIRLVDEQGLIDLIAKYHEGFPARTAAMQDICKALLSEKSKSIGYQLQNPKIYEYEIKQAKHEVLNAFAKLYHLILHDQTWTIDDLNHVEEGYYILEFPYKFGTHCMVYLNLNFGKYLVDPAYGLMKCRDFFPNSTILQHLQYNYDLTRNQIEKSNVLYSYTRQ